MFASIVNWPRKQPQRKDPFTSPGLDAWAKKGDDVVANFGQQICVKAWGNMQHSAGCCCCCCDVAAATVVAAAAAGRMI